MISTDIDARSHRVTKQVLGLHGILSMQNDANQYATDLNNLNVKTVVLFTDSFGHNTTLKSIFNFENIVKR